MSLILTKQRLALLAGCALAVAWAAPAMAGCNSGNIPLSDLLNTGNCQADASGGGCHSRRL